MSPVRFLVAAVAASSVCSLASAQADPYMLVQTNRANNTAGSSLVYYPQGEDYIIFSPVFVQCDGGSQFRLNTVQMGWYRAANALAVDVEVDVATMTFDPATGAYGVGSIVATGSYSATASTSTGAVTSSVTFTWGSTDPTTRPVVSLMTTTNGVNGWGGMWVGQRFKGVNAASTTNAHRICNEPTVGHTENKFAKYSVSGQTATIYTFGNDASSQPNPGRFYLQVGGSVLDGVPPAADLKYGGQCASQWTYKPADNNDGVGSQSIHMPCFIGGVSSGDAFKPRRIEVPVYRYGQPGNPAFAAEVELSLVRMGYDSATASITQGVTVASQSFSLTDRTDVGVENLVWDIAPGSVAVPLSTDNPSYAGSGGLFVAARFKGDATALASSNSLLVGYAPTYGSSANNFYRYSTATPPVFGSYFFGNYSNSTTASPQPRPARMVYRAWGDIGPAAPPCPADLNGDHVVDGGDLGLLLGAWGPCSGLCPADLNADGIVNGGDLGLLLGAWGACPN